MLACSGLSEECAAILGLRGYYRWFISNFADMAEPLVSLTGKDVPIVWRPACSTAFTGLRDALVRAPILSFPTEDGDYILDTDASNFGLGGVLSQIQDNVERVIAYYSRALRLSQRKYCTTKGEMLAAVSMCIQFRSYLRGAKIYTPNGSQVPSVATPVQGHGGHDGSVVTTLQQFQICIIYCVGREHGNADGLSRAPYSPCKQCTRPDCPTVDTTVELSDQPFDAESLGDSEDADLVPVQSGEDWVAQLDDDLSRPASQAGKLFRITALQLEDSTCVTVLEWIRSDTFPPWTEVKSLCPELRFLWHHRNNLSADTNGVIWSSNSHQLQLLIPKAGRQELFLAYHASLFGVIWAGPARWPG